MHDFSRQGGTTAELLAEVRSAVDLPLVAAGGVMDAAGLDAVLRSVSSAVDAAAAANRQAVLVCAPALRPAIHRLVGAQPGSVPVLSYREVTSANVRIETVGVVRHAEPLSA
ncbi:hypothetical protein GCM10010310_80640 [Streptomyces violaceolatus]|uniref:Uncharacterized protein n=1 Tax=Streptomyces violaceolatus TaxID=67378 RepID=A0ABN3THJ3_9ACTN